MLIWLFLLISYLFFLIYPLTHFQYWSISYKDALKKEHLKIVFLSSLIFISIGIIIYLFIANEKFVYYWDFGGYYEITLGVKNKYLENSWTVLKEAFKSSIENDYGTLISAIIAYPLKYTRCRYVDYIMLLYIIYAIPSALSISTLIDRLSVIKNKLNFYVCLIATLLMPWFLVPMLKGYPGIACLLPCTCALWILIESEGLKKLTACEGIALSIALITSMLLRRYFSFWIVSFVFASVCYSICKWIIQKENKSEILIYIKNYFALGVVSLVILIEFCNGFLQRVLFTDYADMYTAYNIGNLSKKYYGFLNHMGILIFVLTIISIFLLIKTNQQYISIIAFAISFELISTLLFYRVQSPGEHHYWIFLLPILVLLELFILVIFNKYSKKLFVIAGICFLYNSIYVYSGSFITNFHSSLSQQDRYEIRKRSDLKELKRMLDFLETSQNGEKIYCIASGSILNTDILRKFYLPDSCPLNLSYVPDIDLRDGFSVDFFDSSIVITTTPVQLHAVDGTQHVITELWNEMENPNSTIGKHFEKIQTFTLEENVYVNIYKKKFDFSKDDILYLQNVYDKLYPDYKELFFDRFENYLLK